MDPQRILMAALAACEEDLAKARDQIQALEYENRQLRVKLLEEDGGSAPKPPDKNR